MKCFHVGPHRYYRNVRLWKSVNAIMLYYDLAVFFISERLVIRTVLFSWFWWRSTSGDVRLKILVKRATQYWLKWIRRKKIKCCSRAIYMLEIKYDPFSTIDWLKVLKRVNQANTFTVVAFVKIAVLFRFSDKDNVHILVLLIQNSPTYRVGAVVFTLICFLNRGFYLVFYSYCFSSFLCDLMVSLLPGSS